MLRRLKKSDCPRLQEINANALGYEVSLELTVAKLDALKQDKHHYFIGFSDDGTDDLLGYVHAERYESLYSKPALNILALAVLPEYQGQGIGRKLLMVLEEKARQENYHFIRLNSASHRKKAHCFYRQLDYIDDKTQLRFLKLL
ncbi:GNAT family N-acetyltransferase [Streptococcus iniae]|uniref:GNAT family N-acetyltransferase n=1 Tax=Streptococcus iniae TaxID=1346 RepID=UPI000EF68BFC|nr:GNAT family N-acetyltransferase [Streptococcus iniae]RLV18580.1 GNAT family N-acetyltransferase [Streptococcus iniae]